MSKTQTPDQCLILAQMHMECINDAWLEFTEAFKPITPERKAVVMDEIGSRIWAAIYLIQHRNEPAELASTHVQEVLREASAFNGLEEDESLDIGGLH